MIKPVQPKVTYMDQGKKASKIYEVCRYTCLEKPQARKAIIMQT